MINIWDFADAYKLRIVAQDGGVYIGDKVAILDAEETGDQEDCIDIRISDGRILGFKTSEIKQITEVKNYG